MKQKGEGNALTFQFDMWWELGVDGFKHVDSWLIPEVGRNVDSGVISELDE